MSDKLALLLEKMTPQEQAEVETFAAYLVTRKTLRNPKHLTDDISIQELTNLVVLAGGFDWLNAEEEDIYSIKDGKDVEWPAS
jgi:hypothetical protein